VSSFADRQLALVERLRGIEARLNALQAQFGDVSLAAATGDAAACKELAAAETETVRLVRERAQLTAAQPSSRSSSRLSSVTPRKRGGTSARLRRVRPQPRSRR
jgi:hypothetical protein